MSTRGRFITFEGGEGCGKTTQIAMLSQSLFEMDIPHITTREPGGTLLSEKIRPLVVEVQEKNEDWKPLSETLLFLAARVQHWQHKIAPALEAGSWVLCDRFIDSTLVYQGIGKGLGLEFLRDLHHRLHGNDWQPEVTILLDMDHAEGLKRAGARKGNETRFESLSPEFHQRLRESFLGLAREEPQRFHVISALGGIGQVHDEIMRALKL